MEKILYKGVQSIDIRIFKLKNSYLSLGWFKNPLLPVSFIFFWTLWAPLAKCLIFGSSRESHLRNNHHVWCHREKVKVGFFSQFFLTRK